MDIYKFKYKIRRNQSVFKMIDIKEVFVMHFGKFEHRNLSYC